MKEKQYDIIGEICKSVVERFVRFRQKKGQWFCEKDELKKHELEAEGPNKHQNNDYTDALHEPQVAVE